MDKVGLVTTIRDDQLLLLSKENATFAPANRKQPCQLYLLALHRDRILAAGKAAGRPCPQLEGDKGLDILVGKIQEHRAGSNRDDEDALKVRIVLSPKNTISITSTLLPATPQTLLLPKSLDDIFKAKPSYRIYISSIKTKPSFHTRWKTTERSAYDKVRSLLPKDDNGLLAEILLVNEKGDIMEGSFTTPYFNHSGWITPAESSGGNLGVTRRWALQKGLCEEGLVSMSSVQAGSLGEKVVLSNGARGFGWGRVEPLET